MFEILACFVKKWEKEQENRGEQSLIITGPDAYSAKNGISNTMILHSPNSLRNIRIFTG